MAILNVLILLISASSLEKYVPTGVLKTGTAREEYVIVCQDTMVPTVQKQHAQQAKYMINQLLDVFQAALLVHT